MTPRVLLPGAPVNRPIRRVGYAVTVLILLLVAQLTYLQVVDANNLANDPKNVRKPAQGVQPRPRRDPHRRRPDRRPVGADHQRPRLQVPARVPAGAACSRTWPATSRSSTWWATPASRSRTTRCSPVGTRACSSTTSATPSTGKPTPTTWCSRSPSRPSRRRRPRWTVSEGRWSRSTCRPARWWRCTRTRRSIPNGLVGHDTAGRADTCTT